MNGGNTSMDMSSGTPIYWHKNQVILTFFSSMSPDASVNEVVQHVSNRLQEINTRALSGTPFGLERLNTHPSGASEMAGIYVYSAPHPTGGSLLPGANLATCCLIHTNAGPTGMHGSSMSDDAEDRTLEIVKRLNAYGQSNRAQTPFHATPHWLSTGVPEETHGCPVTPPFPVTNSGQVGMWKTTLPQLPAALENATGAGVTVFVLDAFPSPEQITNAARTAGNQNVLLQQMAHNLVSDAPFQAQPPAISLNYTYDIPGPMESAVTGKDIYGRLSGFPMPDHGLFIAGLIRDLTPDAQIECIRVLNDYGVGDCQALYQALTAIEERQRTGDLRGKPIVVNMSLVIGPPECDLDRLGLTMQSTAQAETPALSMLLSGLLDLMQSMANQGATFVASAGNDSDPRDFAMNPMEVRFNARYPAAFAMSNPDFPLFADLIPVGAVNQDGKPAAYSNYPGPNGIATYGGELPKPAPWIPSAASHIIAQVDPNSPVDALRGLYSGAAYPALSRNDQYPAAQQAPSLENVPYPLYTSTWTGAWAYWSGTSFAAPIISALAARVLQGQTAPYHGANVYAALAAASQQITWTGLEQGGEATGPLLMARQDWMNEDPRYS